jgi:hypothetical protein
MIHVFSVCSNKQQRTSTFLIQFFFSVYRYVFIQCVLFSSSLMPQTTELLSAGLRLYDEIEYS